MKLIATNIHPCVWKLLKDFRGQSLEVKVHSEADRCGVEAELFYILF